MIEVTTVHTVRACYITRGLRVHSVYFSTIARVRYMCTLRHACTLFEPGTAAPALPRVPYGMVRCASA